MLVCCTIVRHGCSRLQASWPGWLSARITYVACYVENAVGLLELWKPTACASNETRKCAADETTALSAIRSWHHLASDV